MPDTLILLSYLLLLAVTGPRLLAGAAWVERSPRLAIAAWQAMTASVLVGTALAGLSLTLPSVHLGFNLSGLVHACVAALRAQYRTPTGVVTGVGGAVLAVAVIGRAAACVLTTILRGRRLRHRHGQALMLVGTFNATLGAIVVPSAQPAVYCLPGRGHRVVVTSAALAALDGEQLAAALAHEQAHVRQRHDLVVAWTTGLARAFPGVRLFRAAQAETARLVEMLADDQALRYHDRVALAEALVTLASPAGPAVGLAAAVGGVSARVHRLIEPRPPLPRQCRAFAVVGLLLVTIVPILSTSDAFQEIAASCRPPAPNRTVQPIGQPIAAGQSPRAALAVEPSLLSDVALTSEPT